MKSALRIAAILALALAPAAPQDVTVSVSLERPAPLGREALVLIDLSSEHTAMITHAVGLFAEAGLELAPLIVRGGDTETGCGGHDGMHHPHSGWSEIEFCAEATNAAVMHTILHELAHSWAAHALTPERQAAFQELRGFEFWRNYDQAAWQDNGTEQAAEIIAWGLHDRPAAIVRIDQDSCAELRAGFVALTGMEPLHGLTTVCAPSIGPGPS